MGKGVRDAKLVTRRELAAILDYSMSGITKLEQAGCPVLEPGRKGKPSLYSEIAVRAWLAAREEAAKTNGHIDVAQERARKERAQGILAEQTFDIRARNLVPVAEAQKAVDSIAVAVKTTLLAWPMAAAPEIHNAATLHGTRGVEDVLRKLVEDVLRELADPDDPKPKKARKRKRKTSK